MANIIKRPLHPDYHVINEGNLWMLVRRVAKPGKPAGVMYHVAADRKTLWNDVAGKEMMGTGMDKEALKRDGWRAEKVVIAVREPVAATKEHTLVCEICHRKYTDAEADQVCSRLSKEDGGGFKCENCDIPLVKYTPDKKLSRRLHSGSCGSPYGSNCWCGN